MRKTGSATRPMPKQVALFAVAASLAVLLAFPVSGAAARRVTLEARLTGAEVVPPPGDPNARGSARITIRGNRVCWRMQVRGIQRPHAAHVHAARRGREGPPAFGLFFGEMSLERPRRGCETAERADVPVVRDIARNPRRYYVNVHNDEFPNGAVRGQLSRVRSGTRRRTSFLG